MHVNNVNEEGVMKNIQISELSLRISKLTFGWNNNSDREQAIRLMDDVRKLSIEISEFEQRNKTMLQDYQKNQLYRSMEELEQLIPFLKNKIDVEEKTIVIQEELERKLKDKKRMINF